MESFFDEPKAVTEEMKTSLAKMYADGGYRSYLVNAIQIANQNAMTLLEGGDHVKAQAYASRSKSLKQLLDKGKEYFTHFEKLKKLQKVL